MKTIKLPRFLIEAIKNGTKTQHRLPIKPELMFVAKEYDYRNGDFEYHTEMKIYSYTMTRSYGGAHVIDDDQLALAYRFECDGDPDHHVYCQVKSVHIERLVDISEADALAEGIVGFNNNEEGEAPFITYPNFTPKDTQGGCYTSSPTSYFSLFRKLYNRKKLKTDQFVWVINIEKEVQP